jgi:hypothetical protein
MEKNKDRLFAIMADEYVVLKLFWKKEDAEKELKVFKKEHKGGYFFIEEAEIY